MSCDDGDLGGPTPVTHPTTSQSSQFGVDFSDFDPNEALLFSASPCLRGRCWLLIFRSRRCRRSPTPVTDPITSQSSQFGVDFTPILGIGDHPR